MTAVACRTLIAIGLGLLLQSDGSSAPPTYDQCLFASTHNSYSGGSLGTITEQLDSGVREIEFDIHADHVSTAGDYEIGHDSPGHQVALGGGNPPTTHLKDWLKLVRVWSDEHAGHAPITITIDVKGAIIGPLATCAVPGGGLAQKVSFAEGNLAFLNVRLASAFGSKLYKASAYTTNWPPLDELRDKIIIVLSGDFCTRREYRWDLGQNPAGAANAKGQVVEVHDSGFGQLWYWTGQYQPGGTIQWRRHGQYAMGKNAAVAMNDQGWIVEVHESAALPGLCYRVGRMGDDYEIEWFGEFSGAEFDKGPSTQPTISFISPSELQVHEVHTRPATSGDNWEWTGNIDPNTKSISWSGNSPARRDRYARSVVPLNGDVVTFMTGSEGASPNDTICYTTESGRRRRVQYEQIAFVEFQKGDDDALLKDGALFCGAANTAANVQWALAQRQNGRPVRLWRFNTLIPEIEHASGPVINFPATDVPFAAWYRDYCTKIGAMK